MFRRTYLLALLAVSVTVGCSSEDPSTDNNAVNGDNVSPNNDNVDPNVTPNNDNVMVNGTPNGTPNATPNGTPNNTANNTPNNTTNTNNTNNTTATNNTTTPMCMPGTQDCFSNDDCPDGTRCQDVGVAVEMPCCVMGMRGPKQLGEECMNENECASGVCIGRNDGAEICSEDCGDDMDCGDALECVQIPFTGGSGMWCVTP